jgi:hypothetical protein
MPPAAPPPAEGPNTGTPASRSRSATPAASGASGPITTKSTVLASAKLATTPPSVMSISAVSAISAMPALPGATISRSHFGFCLIAQASACSRPPPPSTRMFMDPVPRSFTRLRGVLGCGQAQHKRDRHGPDRRSATRANAPEFTVSEISGAVKRVIEGEFGRVRVRGEVGRVSRPRSGHVYLDLKDERAVLAGVIWKGVAAGLSTQPEEGMEVVATGRLTTFAGQSKYQMVIEEIAPAGLGALMAMLEKRRPRWPPRGCSTPRASARCPICRR